MPALSNERTRKLQTNSRRARGNTIDEEVAKLSFKERWKLLISEMYTTATDRSMGFDIWILVVVLVLLALGLIMMYSASYAYAQYYQDGDSTYYLRRQLLFAVVGIIAMLVASLLPMWFIKRVTWYVVGISVVLLIAVLIVSDESQKRWIRIGSFSFQPSEIGKLAIIIYLAQYMAKNTWRIQTLKYGLIRCAPVFLLIAGLTVIETHLSCFVLMCLIAITIMYIGGTPKKWLLVVLGTVAALGLILIFATDYMKERIDVWNDPFNDGFGGLGAGWQNIQAHYALASGGLLGQGIGNSRQKYLYIAEPQNDFIFAVIGEELGFVGAVAIMIIFALFVWRGLSVSMSNPDRFARLLGVGITAQIGWQTLLNIGVVTRFLPNTGISLPFFSYGGTALVMLLFSVGLLLAVSRGASKKTI